jgi:hypothetical protein
MFEEHGRATTAIPAHLWGGSAVGFAAVPDGEDFDGVAEIMEADAVVADAEPELRGIDVLETFYVAFAGGEETGQSMEDTKRSWLVDGAELSLGLVCPDDLPGHG